MNKWFEWWRRNPEISIPTTLWVLSLIVLWTIELLNGYLIHPFLNFLIVYTVYGGILFLILMAIVYLLVSKRKIREHGNILVKIDPIEKEFGLLRTHSDGVRTYSLDVAINVIDRCEELQLWIWGIDSFLRDEHHTQPFQEFSCDYSHFDKAVNIWDLSREFLRSVHKSNPIFVFEIVYDTKK